jgi:PAS domain S-box-containing protein
MSGLSSDENIILNSVSDGITINSSFTFLYINETFANMVGYSTSELMEMHVLDVIAPEYFDLLNERSRERQQGLELNSIYELELVRKDGTRFPVEFNSSTIEYHGKNARLTITRDISERKQAEKELKEGEERLMLFMHSATDAITLFNENMRFVEVNDRWLQMTGHKKEDVIGKHMLDIYLGLRETGRYVAYLNVLETGEPVEFHGVETNVGPGLFFDVSAFKTGDSLGVVAKDVSDQVIYQRRLEALHRHALELATLNSKEDIAHSTMEILGDLFGFTIGAFGFIEEGKIVFTEFREESSVIELGLDGVGITVRAVNTGETQLVPDTRQDLDYISGGVDRETLSELDVPIKVMGNVVALINLESNNVDTFQEEDQILVETLGMHVGSALNRLNREVVIKNTAEESLRLERELLEEQVRAEQAEELIQMKARFMVSATHELRTPLTMMKGYLELALDAELVPETRELLNVVNRNTDRLTSVTDALLDQQSIEEGQLALTREPVNLNLLVSCVVGEMAGLVEKRGQRIQVESLAESVSVLGAPVRLSQVLGNLLSNASKYSPEGSVVSVKVDRRGGFGLVSVRDEGFGLSEDDIGRLFKPFPGIDRPYVTEQSVGLGLSICRGLVELHGGEIWAESEGHGKGSTFFVKIPV